MVWLLRLALLVVLHGHVSESTCPDSPVAEAEVMVVADDERVVYCLDATAKWSTDDLVLLSQCVNGAWTTPEATCTAGTATYNSPACDVNYPKPDNTQQPTEIQHATAGTTIAVYYRCTSPGAWLSGAHGRVSQCHNGAWTPVHDICDSDCPIPRDCYEVANLGFDNTDLYVIVPSADSTEDSLEVLCELENTTSNAEGRWTTVLWLTKNDLTHTPLEYVEGFGDPAFNSSLSFALGVTHLSSLHYDSLGTERPLVYQYVIRLANGQELHATYTDVMIDGAEPFNMQHAEGYHGNAGNYFLRCNPVGAMATESWGNCPLIKNGALVWNALENIASIQLRVRPKFYDTDTSCPALNISESEWLTMNSTDVDIPISRGHLSRITYSCLGEYMMEGVEGGPRSPYGVVVCSETGKWDGSVTLPCTLYCPADFFKSENKKACYNFLTEDSTFGLTSAALLCSDYNASLAVNFEMKDLVDAAGVYHYTGYTERVPTYQESVTPLAELDATYASSWQMILEFLYSNQSQRYASYGFCPDGNCFQVSNSPACLLATAGGDTKTENCSGSISKPMCMVPASCPPDFVKYRGLCYLFRPHEADIVGTLKACTLRGASLAFPKDMDTLTSIVDMVEFMMTNTSATPPVTVHLGMNDAASTGDWTLGGLFTPSADVVGAMGSTPSTEPPEPWRILSVPGSSPGEAFSVTPSSLTDTATHALCQLHGPIWCMDDPPAATSNMTLTWNGDYVVGTVAEYSCAPGFFMDANITMSNWTMQCLGQLGGWLPQPLPECRQANVCLEDLPVAPSPLITNTTDENVRYLYGTAQYWCPDGMATLQGMTVQNVTCTLNVDVYSFTPTAVEPCNACASTPTAENATTDWVNSTTYEVGLTVTATCLASHHLEVGQNSSVIECTEFGWGNVSACYEACVTSPPEAGDNMAREEFTEDRLGTVLTYNCSSGYWLQGDQENPLPANQTSVTCNSEGEWELERSPLQCVPLCTDDPPAPTSPATSSWDGYNRTVDHEITIACPDGQLLKNLSAVLTIRCEESAQWTSVPNDLLVCTPASNSTPILPANITGATQPEWPGAGPYLVGSSYNVTCADGTMTPSGKTFMTTYLTADGWTAIDADFVCYNVSDVMPDALLELFDQYGVDPAAVVAENGLKEVTLGNVTVTFGDGPYVVGSSVNLTCVTWTSTESGETFLSVAFTPDGWAEVDFVCNSKWPLG
ncbi:uncharacterized protein LOC122259562 [Penaeus japonicus]|uniref:uncharacterized protein LOC122259562 n=1 Tax=Penaeus japonicus TaxID=27405 RepID=UPI001C70F777|nr:uncharacterized protein LOC122259562 [Penaeus japonicus]